MSHIDMYPPLPSFEIFFYFVLWILSYGWAFIQVLFSSQKTGYIRKALYRSDLIHEPEYFLPNPIKDVSDFEWDLWNYWILKMIVYSYSLHFVIMRIFEVLCEKYRFYVSVIFSFGYCWYFFSLKGLFYLLFQSLTCFSVAYTSKSVILSWVASLSMIVFNSYYGISQLDAVFNGDHYLLAAYLCAASMCNLRYTAFCIEHCWKFPNQKSSPSFIRSSLDLLLYQFYFPLFAGGPIINYDNFAQQMQKKRVAWSFQLLFRYIVGVGRYALWHVLTDCLLHYFYFPSIHRDNILMKRVSLLTLCGLALCFVQFFCLKYMVIYGIPSKVALADNMDVPGASHCVSAKHKFTFMWKYFDKGLHKWLVRYIFVPLGGSTIDQGFVRSTVISMMVFAFVYLWHGMMKSHLYWAILNWFGVYAEKIASNVYKTKSFQNFETRYFSPAMSRRLRAVLSTPLFSLLIISNLYFLAGIQAGNLYMRRIYTEDLLSTFLIHLVLYFGAQCSMEFSRRGI